MNCAALPASFGLMTEIWLATMPTGKPRLFNVSILPFWLLIAACHLTHDMRPCGDDIRAILGLEDGQARVIHESKKDLAHIEWLPNIRIDQREKVFHGIPRSKWLDYVDLWWSSYLQRSYPFSSFLNSIESERSRISFSSLSTLVDAVILIRCNLICKPSRHGVDLGASQFLRSNNFTRGHLDQGWTTEESLGLVFHKDGVIRQSRVVRATGCGRTEDNCA